MFRFRPDRLTGVLRLRLAWGLWKLYFLDPQGTPVQIVNEYFNGNVPQAFWSLEYAVDQKMLTPVFYDELIHRDTRCTKRAPSGSFCVPSYSLRVDLIAGYQKVMTFFDDESISTFDSEFE